MNKVSAQQKARYLREIEDIVLDLDEAIANGHISHLELSTLKARFERAAINLEEATELEDSRLFIVNEANALFAWVVGEKKKASELATVAAATKGDKHLTSGAARGLVADRRNDESSVANDMSESPVSGWLGFFYLSVMGFTFIFTIIFLAGITSFLSAGVTGDSLTGILIGFIPAALSLSYLVLALQRSKRAKPVAIMLFGLLTLSCAAIIIIALVYSQFEDLEDAFVALVLLFLITCGSATISYYSRSAKVRRIFSS